MKTAMITAILTVLILGGLAFGGYKAVTIYNDAIDNMNEEFTILEESFLITVSEEEAKRAQLELDLAALQAELELNYYSIEEEDENFQLVFDLMFEYMEILEDFNTTDLEQAALILEQAEALASQLLLMDELAEDFDRLNTKLDLALASIEEGVLFVEESRTLFYTADTDLAILTISKGHVSYSFEFAYRTPLIGANYVEVIQLEKQIDGITEDWFFFADCSEMEDDIRTYNVEDWDEFVREVEVFLEAMTWSDIEQMYLILYNDFYGIE